MKFLFTRDESEEDQFPVIAVSSTPRVRVRVVAGWGLGLRLRLINVRVRVKVLGRRINYREFSLQYP